MTESPFDDLRREVEQHGNTMYSDSLKLVDVAEAAAEFVSTTSYFRQRKESRPEFEKLAAALIALRCNVVTAVFEVPARFLDEPLWGPFLCGDCACTVRAA